MVVPATLRVSDFALRKGIPLRKKTSVRVERFTWSEGDVVLEP